MGAQPYIGDIMMFAGNFAPVGWALCNGQLLPISQNVALWPLIGTTYGGDGVNTFALPDLRGRLPVHQGQGPGLSARVIGQVLGQEGVTVTMNQMPSHSHSPLSAESREGDSTSPGTKWLAKAGVGDARFGSTANANMHGAALGVSGGTQPHSNMMPSLCINFCIALEGIFPSPS